MINGRTIKLSDGRSVFMGRSNKSSGVFIKFDDGKGIQTPLRLSDEAISALVTLWFDAGKPKDESRWFIDMRSIFLSFMHTEKSHD